MQRVHLRGIPPRLSRLRLSLAYVYLSPLMGFVTLPADQIKLEDGSGTSRELVASGVSDIAAPRHPF